MKEARRTASLTLALVLMASAAFAAPPVTPPLPPTLLPTAIPQWVQELPRLIQDIPVTFGTPAVEPSGKSISLVDISMCEFQTSILPAGTALQAGVAGTPPLTWVWGYEAAATCPPPSATGVAHPYIGPVVVAERGIPTQVTYYNSLPDALTSNVAAYTLSTDQTLQWADPFSLKRDGGRNVYTAPPNLCDPASYSFVTGDYAICTPPFPEGNDCNLAVKQFHDGVLDPVTGLPVVPSLPTPCLVNYGSDTPNYTAPIPAAPHLHGGEIPAFLDGGPDAWWTPNGIYGHGYYSRYGVDDAAQGKAVYVYPNVQEPAPTWFHDHVLGATRLNVYAGIAGAYYQIDPNNFPLPVGMGPYTLGTEPLIPLVIQDRMFDPNGELFFPAAGFNLNPEHPFWVPEFVGDVIVVNGKAWPKVTLEPKRYRFLVLNGSNARAYELFLVNTVKKGTAPSIWVIGNDQGFLYKPVELIPTAMANNKLIIMPGERYEIIIDFAGYAGATLQLRNTAGTPYPGGAPVAVGTTDRIVQFEITKPLAAPDTSYNPAGRKGPPVRQTKMVRLVDAAAGTLAKGVVASKRRVLTLNEVMGAGGPIEILMNNTTYTGVESAEKRAASGLSDFTPIMTKWNTTEYSELPQEGETEIWELVNLTADAHPIHPHLVAFQILNRQALGNGYVNAYNTAFPAGNYTPGFGPPCDYTLSGPACIPNNPPIGYVSPLGGNPDPQFYVVGGIMPPLPAEQGWKDTAISYPGEVLRLAIRFAPTTLPATALAAEAFYEFNPNHGHGYVWHCHIIDHEDNEMMRPFSVTANPAATRTFVMGVDY